MREVPTATALLREAAAIFDAPTNPVATSARDAWKRGFVSGGEWMREAMGLVRGRAPIQRAVDFSKLGCLKYGLASVAALSVVPVAVWTKQLWLLCAVVPLFYWVEAQMVFLFPLALDGHRRAIRESRNWTKRAGGTWRVMKTVMPIAGSMVLGGCVGRGFVRSWCLGCLAILIWYERLRKERGGAPARPRLEIGTSQPLQVRRAQFQIFGNAEPVRLLYASDLHCQGDHSRRAARQLVDAARENIPDLIVLGGDLADHPGGLPLLTETVGKLCGCAPVWAIAGNHDEWTGVSEVKAAVERGGGHWLGDRPAFLRRPGRSSFYLDGAIPENISAGHGRILCVHNPKIFPRAAALGYPLVLAGHLHGGQFVCVERRGLLLPAAWFSRWHGTRFAQEQSVMLVSRGVSDTLPLRWNCPREILLCELY